MAIPATIGRFHVVELVGTGAFSAVYHANDERIDAPVAIKVLADHHSLDPDIRDRFLTEARLLRRVNSSNVVRIFDLDETDRHQPFLVLEFVGGGNLTRRRAATVGDVALTPAAIDDVRTAATSITAALGALHGQRIVHRDLSPGNLLVRRTGAAPAPHRVFADGDELVLADLGLSKDLAVSSGLTVAAGTDGFAAPEQRRLGTVNERVDVYAASALITWLILGHRPGTTDRAELDAAGWPHAVADVLERGLAVEPASRPATIAQWRDRVVESLEPPPVTQPPSRVAETVGTQISARARPSDARRPTETRRRLAAALGFAVAALVGGLIVRPMFRSDASPTTTDATVTRTTAADAATATYSITADGVTASFTGPRQLVVGEPATFTADTAGLVGWTWASGSRVVHDVASIDLTPRTDGELTLSLVAVAADGRTATARATIPVTAATTALNTQAG